MHDRTNRRSFAAVLAAITSATAAIPAISPAPVDAKRRRRKNREKVRPVRSRFHFTETDLHPHPNGTKGHHELIGSGDDRTVTITRDGRDRTMSLAAYVRSFGKYTKGEPLVTVGKRQFRLHEHSHHRPSGTLTFHLIEEQSAGVIASGDDAVRTCCCMGQGMKDGYKGYHCCGCLNNEWCSFPGETCESACRGCFDACPHIDIDFPIITHATDSSQ